MARPARPTRRTFLALALAATLAGCGDDGAPPPPAESRIVLATTTSTRDSGLLDHLAPLLAADTGVTLDVVAVGSGRALRMGRDGDADLLMTHAPRGEEELVADGTATERRPVMYNDFVLVGPAADPAGVAGVATIAEALERIAGSGASFVSRGDDSGTHRKERALWRLTATPEPAFAGYLESGRGMGATLTMADELAAYTLTDRATRLNHDARDRLPILVSGDPPLRNPYAVLLLNPARHPHLKHDAARRVADWLVSEAGRRAIADFRLQGEAVFFLFDRDG